ncbi:MAG: ribonuclease III family protein [Candidatus Thermoplasmatota archaeon]
MDDEKLDELEKKIGYSFNNRKLLVTALTHKTYAYEARKPLEFNERLEFLGDSSLDLVVAEMLYKTNRYFSEGELTRRRANLVNNVFLAEKAGEIGLGSYLRLGKGEKKQCGNENDTNLANCLEAMIGAIYLDSGLEEVKSFIAEHIFDEEMKI